MLTKFLFVGYCYSFEVRITYLSQYVFAHTTESYRLAEVHDLFVLAAKNSVSHAFKSPDWPSYYSDTDSIETYIQAVANKYQVPQYVRLRHSIIAAKWDEVGLPFESKAPF
jgi:cation diffusion facilitator CzcD-associated flavoprotein CzcO